MKKLMLMLMVAAIAAPLYAAGQVNFIATDNLDGTCTVTFDANDLIGVNPVAMALEIDVVDGDPCEKITAVSGIDSFFDIYMDYAYDAVDPCTGSGYEYGDGHPVAELAEAGAATLPLYDFCISMGGLGGETGGGEAPDNGTAFVLEAANKVFDPCDPCDVVEGTICVNALRGGVVGTDTEPMETNLCIEFTISPMEGCMPQSATTADPVGLAVNDSPEANGSTTYDEWIAAGSPECWCYQAHCRGNADGITNGSSKTGYYVVGALDLNVLTAAWGVYEPPAGVGAANVYSTENVPGICANFNRMLNGSSKTGYYHVGADDLSRLIASWGVYQPPAGSGVPLNDCGGDLINDGSDF